MNLNNELALYMSLSDRSSHMAKKVSKGVRVIIEQQGTMLTDSMRKLLQEFSNDQLEQDGLENMVHPQCLRLRLSLCLYRDIQPSTFLACIINACFAHGNYTQSFQ